MLVNSIIHKIKNQVFPKKHPVEPKEPKDSNTTECCSSEASLASKNLFIGVQNAKIGKEIEVEVSNLITNPWELDFFARNIYQLDPKSISDILEAEVFTDEQKDKLRGLYSHFDELGYKEFIDSHPKLFQGMAGATFTIPINYPFDYGKLNKNEFEIIKDAVEQYDEGLIKPEWAEAIMARMEDSTPYAWFRYIDDFDSIPDELPVHENGFYGSTRKKEDVIKELTRARALRECLNNQSTKHDIKVFRIDDGRVFTNGNSGSKDIYKLIRAGKKDKVLNLLNNNPKYKKVKYNNFIGTTLGSNCRKPGTTDSILWELDVPKGTKGLFLSGINSDKYPGLFSEAEFLLQTDSTFEIESAEYVDSSYHIKAKVIQD